MLLDLSLFTGTEQFHSKFIRVGNEVYITNPDDLTTLHAQLAEMHKVLDRIYDWKTGNKDEVDGGEIFVQGMVIRIGAHSEGLGLPLTQKARDITVRKLKKKNPKFSIRDLSAEE
jgi:hypothetical protein